MRTPGLGAGKRGRGICLCDLQKVTGSCPGDPVIVCCFSYGVPTGLGPPHIQVVSLSFA